MNKQDIKRQEKIKEWIDDNCDRTKEVIHLSKNNNDYEVYTMNDGWLALFMVEYDGIHPLIEAKDMKAINSYVTMKERITVPFNVIVNE